MQMPAEAPTDQDIHDRMFEAILARRLRPGVRLGEQELAGHFGVSRTKVRHALAMLAQDGVVQLRRNHGASVAAPSRAQAREVIELRCMIEPPIAAALAGISDPAGIARLRGHIEAEQAARAAGDDPALIRLTGEFHLLLAGMHGNALLLRTLREAEALLCLCILSYGRPGSSACLPDEHERILDAIEAGEPDAASSLMLHHLRHVAAELDLHEPRPELPTLSAALRLAAAQTPRAGRTAA